MITEKEKKLIQIEIEKHEKEYNNLITQNTPFNSGWEQGFIRGLQEAIRIIETNK
jgi:hypothetical protein